MINTGCGSRVINHNGYARRLRTTLSALIVCLLTFVSLSPTDAKMIADTLVIHGATNNVNNTNNNEAIIIYNPTPVEMGVFGYRVINRNSGLYQDLGGSETVGAFGYFAIGDAGGLGADYVDSSVGIFGVINGTDSVELRFGNTTLDYWDLGDGTTGHSGDKRETSPVNWTNSTHIFRRPALNFKRMPSSATDSPVSWGGGMINRAGLTDIFEDTRGDAQTDVAALANRRRGMVDRMLFLCTGPTTVREGSRFFISCTTIVNFGKVSLTTDLPKWEATNYPDSVVTDYTGNLAWADMTINSGNLNGLFADSRFTNGLLQNYVISINDTRDGPLRLVVADAHCSGVLNFSVLYDTGTILGINHSDTYGGRDCAFSVRLRFPVPRTCTAIFEYDTYNSGEFDSITFIDSEWGPGQASPDSTLNLSTDTNGLTYKFHWNIRADKPDTQIPVVRLRMRVWNADTGSYLGDTLMPISISTVLADPPDTPDAFSLGYGDSVRIIWNPDSWARYFVVWRDTGWPPNDTEKFVNVTKMIYGTDSQADSLGVSIHDTHVGQAPKKRTPTLDTYWVWYITAIDTWNNIHERMYGYGDSIPAEYLYVAKVSETGPSIRGIVSDTIPGATLQYHILVSNTPGYSPAYNPRVIDYIPAFTDYKNTSTYVDTLYEQVLQTDNNDTDYARYVIGVDTHFLQLDLHNPFSPGDTARIRFKVIIR